MLELSRQKELDADSNAIQQIDFVRQFKNSGNAIVANGSVIVLKIWKKSRRRD